MPVVLLMWPFQGCVAHQNPIHFSIRVSVQLRLSFQFRIKLNAHFKSINYMKYRDESHRELWKCRGKSGLRFHRVLTLNDTTKAPVAHSLTRGAMIFGAWCIFSCIGPPSDWILCSDYEKGDHTAMRSRHSSNMEQQPHPGHPVIELTPWTLGSAWRSHHQALTPQPHLGDEVNLRMLATANLTGVRGIRGPQHDRNFGPIFHSPPAFRNLRWRQFMQFLDLSRQVSHWWRLTMRISRVQPWSRGRSAGSLSRVSGWYSSLPPTHPPLPPLLTYATGDSHQVFIWYVEVRDSRSQVEHDGRSVWTQRLRHGAQHIQVVGQGAELHGKQRSCRLDLSTPRRKHSVSNIPAIFTPLKWFTYSIAHEHLNHRTRSSPETYVGHSHRIPCLPVSSHFVITSHFVMPVVFCNNTCRTLLCTLYLSHTWCFFWTWSVPILNLIGAYSELGPVPILNLIRCLFWTWFGAYSDLDPVPILNLVRCLFWTWSGAYSELRPVPILNLIWCLFWTWSGAYSELDPVPILELIGAYSELDLVPILNLVRCLFWTWSGAYSELDRCLFWTWSGAYCELDPAPILNLIR